jgi:23S rRNA pseudouridine2605 synthase
VPGRAERAPAEREGIRLQKVLAAAGVASRRAAEELIAAGRVEVDGDVVREQGRRVDPATAVIKVDGLRVATEAAGLVHLALNKPRGVVSTMDDPEGRPDLSPYVTGRAERLFHVGRLDADTEGLLLLTNDGELANRLTHPRWEVAKTYVAEVEGPLGRGVVRQLRDGVELEEGLTTVDAFRVVGSAGNRVMVELVVHEGRKHLVRRLLAEVGHPVQRLVRTKLGPVSLGDQRPGRLRPLTRGEVGRLYQEVGL